MLPRGPGTSPLLLACGLSALGGSIAFAAPTPQTLPKAQTDPAAAMSVKELNALDLSALAKPIKDVKLVKPLDLPGVAAVGKDFGFLVSKARIRPRRKLEPKKPYIDAKTFMEYHEVAAYPQYGFVLVASDESVVVQFEAERGVDYVVSCAVSNTGTWHISASLDGSHDLGEWKHEVTQVSVGIPAAGHDRTARVRVVRVSPSELLDVGSLSWCQIIPSGP